MKHQIRWYVYTPGEKIPHTASMRGSWPGWDAECSCGWGSQFGGGIKARIKEAVYWHKWDVANGWWPQE